MNFANIVFDLILLSLIVFFIIRGYTTGLIRTAFRPKRIYSFILAYKFYQKLSDKICETYVMPYVRTQVDKAVANALEGKDVTAQGLVDSIPGFFKKIAEMCGLNLEEVAQNAVDGAGNAVSDFISAIAGYAANIVSVIVSFLIIYFISKIALHIAEAILNKVFEMKILNIVNKIGGLVFGVVSAYLFGVIFAMIFAYGVGALAESGKIAFLSSFNADTTWIIRFMLNISPLRWFS